MTRLPEWAAGVVKWLAARPFLRDVTSVSAGTVVAMAAGVLSLPLLSRLYTPAEFGTYAAFLSVYAPLLAVSSLRLDLAIPVPKSDREGLALVASALWVTLAIAVAVGVTAWALGIRGWAEIGIPELAPWAWALPVGLVFGGTYQVLSFWSTRRGQFGTLGRTKVVQALTMLVVQLGGGAFAGPGGLVVGEVTGRGAGSSTLLKAGWGRLRVLGRVRTSEMLAVLRKYRGYPSFMAPSALLATASIQAIPLAFAVVYDVSTAGQYALASKVLVLPAVLVGRSVAQVFLRAAAEAAHDGPAALIGLYRGVLGKLVRVGAVPFAVAAALAIPAFPLFFGAEWSEAGQMCAAAAIGAYAQFVVSPLTHALVVTGQQRLHMGWDIARFGGVVSIVGVAAMADWKPVTLALALSMVVAAMYTIHVGLTRFALSRAR